MRLFFSGSPLSLVPLPVCTSPIILRDGLSASWLRVSSVFASTSNDGERDKRCIVDRQSLLLVDELKWEIKLLEILGPREGCQIQERSTELY
jgi:hypothetical protein